jgi:hypothetical protein
MTGPQVQLTGGGVLVGVGLLVGGVLAYTAYKKGAGLLGSAAEAIGQAVDQTAATVQSTWANSFVGPFQQGQDYMANGGVTPPKTFNELMYGDYYYTGQQGGQMVTDGEWLSNEDARQYSAAQLASGSTPPAQSNNGAAFGIYPSAFGTGVTGSW